MANSPLPKVPPKLDEGKPTGGPARYLFELWRVEKFDNKAEHNMVERDGKTWYWCDRHKYNNKGVISNGMYVTHKPDGHDDWFARRKNGRKGGATALTSNKATGKPTTTPSVSNDSSALKLSLSKLLQAALVTTAGISEDQFKKILAKACSANGPKCRIENIMDVFIFPIIFSIRAAISILLLL